MRSQQGRGNTCLGRSRVTEGWGVSDLKREAAPDRCSSTTINALFFGFEEKWGSAAGGSGAAGRLSVLPSLSYSWCVAPRCAGLVLMGRMIVALIALPVAMGAGVFKIAAAENCIIGDSALCAANPNCHWAYKLRGCYPGPLPRQDPCVVHEDRTVCDTDTSLGCKWNAEGSKCQKAN